MSLDQAADRSSSAERDSVARQTVARASWFERVMLIAYAALISLMSLRHEPWKDETQTWRMAIDSQGLVDLWRNSRYEGHPLLFHLLLQTVGHVSRSWWAAATLHVLIACIAVWIVLRYAPFSRLQKVLVVFGYFPAYEYAVVVRPYGLGMLLAFAACVAWTATRRRRGWTALWLVLLANTSVMGTLLAMTLVLAFAVEWAWPDDVAARPARRQLVTGGAIALAATVIVLWVAVVQMKPAADAAYKGETPVVSAMSRWDIASIPTVELRALIPLVRDEDGPKWNAWLLRPDSTRALAANLALSLVALAIGVVIASRRRTALLFFVVGTTGYILFFAFFIPGSAHHHGFLFLVWVIAAWLAWSGPPSERPRVLRLLTERLDAERPFLFTLSLLPAIVATIQIGGADLRLPFSDARHVADVIRSQGLEHAPIIGVVRSHAQSVGAFLDHDVLYPVEGKSYGFVVWGRGASYHRTVGAADSAATALLTRECRVLLIASPSQDVSSSTAARSKLIYTTPGRPMSGDRYRVWLTSAPVSDRCPAASR
jgi:hypothetical protein